MTTLVLLPGMDGTGALFLPFVEAIGNSFSAKVIEYPMSESLGYSGLESIVRSALPTDGPFVILGESFSGPIAIAVAAYRSRGLIGLILGCTFAISPRPRLRSLGLLSCVVPTGPFFIRCFGTVMCGRFLAPVVREVLVKALSKVAPAALRSRLRAVLAADVTAALTAVDVPILYLLAKADLAVPARAAQLIKSIQPRTEIVEIDAPHFMLQAVPKKLSI